MSEKPRSLSKKIIGNTIYTGIGRIWVMLTNFLLTPYIISRIGIEQYGVWVLIYSIVGFLSLIDLGMGSTYVKFISEYKIKEDFAGINRIVNSGLLLNILIGLVVSISLLFRDQLISAFRFQSVSHKEIYFLLTLAILLFVSNFILSVFSSIIEGSQRMDITNKINIFVSLLNIGGVVVFLGKGYGLNGLMYNNMIIVAVSSALNIYFAHRLIPQMRMSISMARISGIKQIAGYGIKVQMSRIAVFVNQQLDKIILGHFVNLTTVGLYDIGARISMMPRQTSLVLFPAIVPAASELYTLNDIERLNLLYMRGSRYLSMIAIPMALYIFTTAGLIIQAWMGSGYSASVLVTRFLVVGFTVNVLTGVGTSIARGIGKPEIEMEYTVLIAIFNSLLSLFLVIKMGLIGALIGTSISLVIFSSYFMVIFHKRVIRTSLFDFVVDVYGRPFMASLSLCIPIYLLNLGCARFMDLNSRIHCLYLLAMDSGVFFIVYVFLIFRLRYLEIEEVKTIIRHIKS